VLQISAVRGNGRTAAASGLDGIPANQTSPVIRGEKPGSIFMLPFRRL
jgi:hypothetical protein